MTRKLIFNVLRQKLNFTLLRTYVHLSCVLIFQIIVWCHDGNSVHLSNFPWKWNTVVVYSFFMEFLYSTKVCRFFDDLTHLFFVVLIWVRVQIRVIFYAEYMDITQFCFRRFHLKFQADKIQDSIEENHATTRRTWFWLDVASCVNFQHWNISVLRKSTFDCSTDCSFKSVLEKLLKYFLHFLGFSFSIHHVEAVLENEVPSLLLWMWPKLVKTAKIMISTLKTSHLKF